MGAQVHSQIVDMPGKKAGYSRSAKALPRQPRGSRSRSRSKSPGGKKKGRKARSASPGKVAKKPVDLMSPAAMTNAYYIAHGAQEFLDMRGFGWPDAPKGKKKGKGKKKKKK